MSLSRHSSTASSDNGSDTSSTTSSDSSSSKKRGKLLVLGGTGYLGRTVCQKAVLEGYSVVSLSRRGHPPRETDSIDSSKVHYRQGDARQAESIRKILDEGGFTGVIHCVGLLFDDASGLGNLNRFVSGSGSLPDADSTYDAITRLTAFNAIDATIDYVNKNSLPVPFPFCFTSAAEAGWPDVTGGPFIESVMPDFIKRYMKAKREVEAKLMNESQPTLRPIIVRPSLIYDMSRPAALPAVGTFAMANKIGLPFVDRPVTVHALASAMVRAMGRPSVKGVQRYPEIDQLSA